MRDKTFF